MSSESFSMYPFPICTFLIGLCDQVELSNDIYFEQKHNFVNYLSMFYMEIVILTFFNKNITFIIVVVRMIFPVFVIYLIVHVRF